MYQLVVTRAFQEGEEQLLEEDAESKFLPDLLTHRLKLIKVLRFTRRFR